MDMHAMTMQSDQGRSSSSSRTKGPDQGLSCNSSGHDRPQSSSWVIPQFYAQLIFNHQSAYLPPKSGLNEDVEQEAVLLRISAYY